MSVFSPFGRFPLGVVTQSPAPIYVYKGPSTWATRYKGAKTDAQLYKGAKTLHS